MWMHDERNEVNSLLAAIKIPIDEEREMHNARELALAPAKEQ